MRIGVVAALCRFEIHRERAVMPGLRLFYLTHEGVQVAKRLRDLGARCAREDLPVECDCFSKVTLRPKQLGNALLNSQ